jgi:hypothetical protein
MRFRKPLTIFILVLGLSFALPVWAQKKPLTREQVSNMAKGGMGDDSGAKLISQRGIDFVPTEDFLKALKAAGAGEAFLKALRDVAPPDAASEKKPLHPVQILALLGAGVPTSRITVLVKNLGIDFEPKQDYLDEIKLGGGDEELIAALKGARVVKPPPTPEELEAQDWDHARNASDANQMEAFLAKYPKGPHADEAQSKLQDLVWGGTNRGDVGALQAYLSRFPNSPHSGEASRLIDDLFWSKVDKKNRQALTAFTAQHPNSPHCSDAEAMMSEMEKPPPALGKHAPSAAEAQAIIAALDEFNTAFEHKQPREVKQIWPAIPDRYLEANSVPGATFVMELHASGEAEIDGDAATIPSQMTTHTAVTGGRPSQTKKPVTVYLSRTSGDRWIIVNVLIPIR